LLLVLQCDVIIDESYEQSTGGLTEMDATNPDGFLQTHNIKAYADQIPAVTAKTVYTLAGTTGVTVTNPNSPMKGYIGLDWFERGVSRADEVRCCKQSVQGGSTGVMHCPYMWKS
jgi:hypothetical protein